MPVNKPDLRFSADQLAESLSLLPAGRSYWVGYSGGADSTALLTALGELKSHQNLNVRALHINHGLHPDCDKWQIHCEKYCLDLGVPLETQHIFVSRDSGHGLEAEARRLRYGIAASLLEKNDIFLTAHHRNDQAETLLLNLMRGSGVDGLAGMPESRPLGKGLLARPLLHFRMESLQQYLLDLGIGWIEDPSNENVDYDRNFLRHELIPFIEKRWPGVYDQLAHSTVLCREASSVLGRWAEEKLSTCLLHDQVLDLTKLPATPEEFRIMVRQWLRINHAPPVPGMRLVELCEQLILATAPTRLRIMWTGWEIRQFRQSLWLQTTDQPLDLDPIAWSEPTRLDLGQVSGDIEFKGSATLPRTNLIVRGRSGGESLLMHGSKRRKVKDLLRESGFPPWLRPSIPIIMAGNEVLAIADLFISDPLRDWLNSGQAELVWQPGQPLLRFCRHRFKAAAVDRESALR